MSTLRDPIWGFIAVIVAILLAGVGIAVTVWFRNKKSLSYQVVSNVPIATVQHGNNNTVSEDIEIRYKGEPVRDVRQVVVRVWNSGNQPIAPSDYVEPVTITFEGKVLASDVVEASSDSLKHNAIAGGGVGPGFGAIGLRNLLLNQKDWIVVQALVTDFAGTVVVEGRIVGIPTIRLVYPTSMSYWDMLGTASTLAATLVSAWILANTKRHSPEVQWVAVFGFTVLALAFAFIFFARFFRRLVLASGVLRRTTTQYTSHQSED